MIHESGINALILTFHSKLFSLEALEEPFDINTEVKEYNTCTPQRLSLL